MPSVTCRKARVNSNMKHIIFYNYVSLEIYSAQSPEVFGWGKKKKQKKQPTKTNQTKNNNSKHNLDFCQKSAKLLFILEFFTQEE